MDYLDAFDFDSSYFNTLLHQVIHDQNLSTLPIDLQQDIKTLVTTPGKRIRPLLLLLTTTLGKCNKKEAYTAAVAVELLHLSSLVHDDIIDKATVRRNQMTLNTKYNDYTALHVGNYLLNKSISLFSSFKNKELHTAVAQAMSSLCSGEYVQAHDFFNFQLTEEQYLQKSYKKTGTLLALSFQVGSIIAKLDSSTSELLQELAHDIGISYQIYDDLSDFQVDSTLKNTQQDLKNGILTLPTIYALQDDDLRNDILLLNSHTSDSQFTKVYDKIKTSDYLLKSQEVCQIFVADAKKKVLQLPKQQDAFLTLISSLVK